MKLSKAELSDFLNEKVELYNNPNFIESDPISIPHSFSNKEDIEIAGLLSATIAWGQRKTIINNSYPPPIPRIRAAPTVLPRLISPPKLRPRGQS